MITIGDRIRKRRKELNLTQLQLAEKLNVTDRAVSKWEKNDGNPDFTILPTLAEVLNVSLDYLIAGKIYTKATVGFDEEIEDDSNSKDAIKCKVCGEMIPHGVLFCPTCGERISSK